MAEISRIRRHRHCRRSYRQLANLVTEMQGRLEDRRYPRPLRSLDGITVRTMQELEVADNAPRMLDVDELPSRRIPEDTSLATRPIACQTQFRFPPVARCCARPMRRQDGGRNSTAKNPHARTQDGTGA